VGEEFHNGSKFLEGKGVSLKDKKGNPTAKVPNPKFSEPLMCHCWQQCMSHIAGGISASMVVSTKLLASSMKRANAPFVFVIARSCVPKSELILLILFSFDSVLVCLIQIQLSVLTPKRRIISILNVQKVCNLKRKWLQMRVT